MTVFKSRSFGYPKDPENPQQNQDSFQVNDSTGLAVVADGVSSAIFSAAWANILTKHIIQDQPDPTNSVAFAQWLSNLRAEWEQSIDVSNLSWFQRPKLAAGAFSTLVWVQVREIAPPKPGSNLWNRLQNPDSGRRCFHVKGHCIGDSCLFHVRPGRSDSEIFSGSDLYRAIPISTSKGFDLPPVVIGSKDLGRDDQMKFQPVDFLAEEGDLVILATDAVSQWLLRCYETQAFPCWDLFWNLAPEQWGQELDAMRSAGEIRYDDSTLVLLQLGNSNVFLNQIPDVSEAQEEVLPEPSSESEPSSVRETVSESEFVSESESSLEPEFVSEFTAVPEQELAVEQGGSEESAVGGVVSSDFLAVQESAAGAVAFSEETEVRSESPGSLSEEVMRDFHPAETQQTVQPISQSVSQSVSRPVPPEPPVFHQGSVPQPGGGFQYRMASSATTRKFDSVPVSSPRPETHKPSGVHSIQNAQNPEVRQSPSLTLDDAAKLRENWKQIKESSSQLAGIIGEQLGERISEGMNRLGSNLNEGVSQLSEAAKPKLQSVTQRFTSLFTRKKSGQPEETEDLEENHTENKTLGRVIDPNRRRFYNPPPRE